MRKPTFCIRENKGQDQLRSNGGADQLVTVQLISDFVFATWIAQSLFFLNLKYVKKFATVHPSVYRLKSDIMN